MKLIKYQIKEVRKLKPYLLKFFQHNQLKSSKLLEIEEIKNLLPSVYNICAIDMESAAFAQVCYKTGVPFVSIRAISDNPLLPKNHEEQYDDFWRNIAEVAFKALFKLI